MPAIERRSGRLTCLVAGLAPAAEELDLDRVHRVDVGIPEPDRALHDRVAVEQLARLDDLEHGRDRALVLGADRLVQARVLDEVEVAGARSRGSTSRASSRGSRRASGRRPSRGRGGAARATSAPAKAVPQPYHAGSRQRFCVHAKTQGIARSEPRSSPPSGRRAGREPISSSASSSTGVKLRKNGTKALVLPDERRGRRRTRAPREPLERRPARRPAGSDPATSGNADRSVAASAASRLRYARPGRPYLNEIVSPCSVSLRRPGGWPAGWARIAACVGPPPRPVLPPRPWKIVSSIPRSRRERGERLLRAVDLPLRRQVAAVLARVRVADHHLEAAAALLDDARRTRLVEQRLDDRGRRAQVGDRLEERHRRDARAGLVGESTTASTSAARRRAGDDHRVERALPEPALRIARRRRSVSRTRGSAGQLRRVEAHVELRDVEAEELDAAAQGGEPAVGDARAAVSRAGSGR